MEDRWGAAFVRIAWQASFGLGGSFAPDWVAGITGIRTQRPPQNDPHVGARQSPPYRHAALEGKFRDQGPFAALFDHERVPRVWGHGGGELIDALRSRFPGQHAGLAGAAAPPPPSRHRRRGPRPPR